MPPSGIPFALPAGTIITGYEIIRALGAGGFGITYEGYNRVTRRRVAIKEFFPRGMASREGATQIVFSEHDGDIARWALQRFEESTTALAELEHRNILQVLNYVADHGTGYMVMEHIDGETLDRWLRERSVLPRLDDLRPILEPILDALEYVHQRNLLHRDIAPDNIMIAKGGRPVLIDFGAIKVIEEETRIRTGGSYAVGKRYYSPPEQLSGAAKLDARTDIYALAAVLYRALTGEPPVDADHRRADVIDGSGDPYVSIGATKAHPLPKAAEAAIDRALSLRRDDRPANVAAMRAAFGWGLEPRIEETEAGPDVMRRPTSVPGPAAERPAEQVSETSAFPEPQTREEPAANAPAFSMIPEPPHLPAERAVSISPFAPYPPHEIPAAPAAHPDHSSSGNSATVMPDASAPARHPEPATRKPDRARALLSIVLVLLIGAGVFAANRYFQRALETPPLERALDHEDPLRVLANAASLFSAAAFLCRARRCE